MVVLWLCRLRSKCFSILKVSRVSRETRQRPGSFLSLYRLSIGSVFLAQGRRLDATWPHSACAKESIHYIIYIMYLISRMFAGFPATDCPSAAVVLELAPEVGLWAGLLLGEHLQLETMCFTAP